MSIKRSSIQLIVAMCLVISLVGAMLPLQSTIALQSGTRNAPIQSARQRFSNRDVPL